MLDRFRAPRDLLLKGYLILLINFELRLQALELIHQILDTVMNLILIDRITRRALSEAHLAILLPMLLFDFLKWGKLLSGIAAWSAASIRAHRCAVVLIVPHLVFEHKMACGASLALHDKSIEDGTHVPVQRIELGWRISQAMRANWLLNRVWASLIV